MSETADEVVFPNLISNLDVPRVPQQARSRQKRDALLAAAARLFEQRGYEATTADDIAAAAGVSIGAFYSYFRNKRQVFLTLYSTCIESIVGLGIAEIDFGANPREAIRQTVRRSRQRDQLFYGLRRAWAELLPRDPEIAAYNDQLNRLIYSQILVAVRKVVAHGLAWPDLDVERTCWLITVLLDQSWHNEPAPGEATAEELQRADEALADLIYHAVFKR